MGIIKTSRKKYVRGIKATENGGSDFSVQKNRQINKQIVSFSEKHYKNAIKISLLICGAMLVVALSAFVVRENKPYAITVNNQPVCKLKSEKAAEDVLYSVARHYSVSESKIKAFSANKKVNVEPCHDKKMDKLTKSQATKYLIEEYIPDNDIVVSVTSIKDSEEKFEPEPTYKKDDKMLAGDSRVEKESVKGKHIVTISYSTENGKIINSEKYEKKIIYKGIPAVIYKGTLGLPEGEDWKTFDGDPVFKDGADLTETALTYQGLRYKYGGNSLKTGVDCVTFVWNMYKLYGINLKCSHSGLQHAGTAVSLKNARKGDIVCYYGHVAIYLGDGKIVHASPGKGVHVSNNVNYRKIKTVRRVVSD